MKTEHCHSKDSDTLFTTSNYFVTTLPWIEWLFV